MSPEAAFALLAQMGEQLAEIARLRGVVAKQEQMIQQLLPKETVIPPGAPVSDPEAK